MSLDEFRTSLTQVEPLAELTLALAGLWWDAKGDWTRAHELAQQDEGTDGSWVHAYLHLQEPICYPNPLAKNSALLQYGVVQIEMKCKDFSKRGQMLEGVIP